MSDWITITNLVLNTIICVGIIYTVLHYYKSEKRWEIKDLEKLRKMTETRTDSWNQEYHRNFSNAHYGESP